MNPATTVVQQNTDGNAIVPLPDAIRKRARPEDASLPNQINEQPAKRRRRRRRPRKSNKTVEGDTGYQGQQQAETTQSAATPLPVSVPPAPAPLPASIVTNEPVQGHAQETVCATMPLDTGMEQEKKKRKRKRVHKKKQQANESTIITNPPLQQNCPLPPLPPPQQQNVSLPLQQQNCRQQQVLSSSQQQQQQQQQQRTRKYQQQPFQKNNFKSRQPQIQSSFQQQSHRNLQQHNPQYNPQQQQNKQQNKQEVKKNELQQERKKEKQDWRHYAQGNYKTYYSYRLQTRKGESDQGSAHRHHGADRRFNYFRKEWFAGKDVLDMGCNSGFVTIGVAERYLPKTILGVDLDAGLISQAKSSLQRLVAKRYSRMDDDTRGRVSAAWERILIQSGELDKDTLAQVASLAEKQGECPTVAADAKSAASEVKDVTMSGDETANSDKDASLASATGSLSTNELSSIPSTGADVHKGDVPSQQNDSESAAKENDNSNHAARQLLPHTQETLENDSQEGSGGKCDEKGSGANASTLSPADNAPKRDALLRLYLTENAKIQIPPPVGPSPFPYNIAFFCEDFMKDTDGPFTPQFDVILCLSVTKWVHLNYGDEGIKRLFKKFFALLRPGGVLILEPQKWKGYKKRSRISDVTYYNYKHIQLRPTDFSDILTTEAQFDSSELLYVPSTAQGFDRPIYAFWKAPEAKPATTAETSSNEQGKAHPVVRAAAETSTASVTSSETSSGTSAEASGDASSITQPPAQQSTVTRVDSETQTIGQENNALGDDITEPPVETTAPALDSSKSESAGNATAAAQNEQRETHPQEGK